MLRDIVLGSDRSYVRWTTASGGERPVYRGTGPPAPPFEPD